MIPNKTQKIMANFNKSVKGPSPKILGRKQNSANFAGGKAFSLSKRLEITQVALNSFISDQFYCSSKDTLAKIRELVNDPEVGLDFLKSLAGWSRKVANMRSVSHAIVGEMVLGNLFKDDRNAAHFFRNMVVRPDDMMEIVAYIWQDGRRPLPRSLIKGFALAIENCAPERLAKFARSNSEVKLVDIVNLVHPKYNQFVTVDGKRVNGLGAILDGTLVDNTASMRALSKIGQIKGGAEKDLAKLEFFEASLESDSIGYIDLIRNLNKVFETRSESAISSALEKIGDEKAVLKSRIMPYQIAIARKKVSEKRAFESMDKALDYSCRNISVLEGKTLVVVDRSGSMAAPVSNGDASVFSMAEVGTLMGLFLAKVNVADMMIFGDRAEMVSKFVDFGDSIFENLVKLQRLNNGPYSMGNVGHGTNFSSIFETLEKEGRSYDHIFIFSDMQSWRGNLPKVFAEYVGKVGKKPEVWNFDLGGYGSLQFPEEKVRCLGGFSPRIFELIEILRGGVENLVQQVEKYQYWA